MPRPKTNPTDYSEIKFRKAGPAWDAVCYYTNELGTYKRVTARGKTKGAARARLEEKLAPKPHLSGVQAPKTLDELIGIYVRSLTGRVSPQSLETYNTLAKSTAHYIGPLPLTAVNTPELQTRLDVVVNAGMVRRAREIRSLVSRALKYATRRGWVERNFAADTEVTAPRKGKIRTLEMEEVARLRTLVPSVRARSTQEDHRAQNFVSLCFTSSLVTTSTVASICVAR